jgi:Putative translation factor (SUA5)
MELLDSSDKSLKLAGQAIAAGKLVVIPTETVYGLGADAFNPDAVARVFEAKRRPSFDPLIVHIARLDQIDRLVSKFTSKARLLAENLGRAPSPWYCRSAPRSLVLSPPVWIPWRCAFPPKSWRERS